jgi:hypothetical protein
MLNSVGFRMCFITQSLLNMHTYNYLLNKLSIEANLTIP